ncbi:MAG TPA: POTRA domain-containing protein, partial [Pyrinomonadaceae bacterium]|nr:POTRA domain-containing protein [Pyrinomonadaceae bacterium]
KIGDTFDRSRIDESIKRINESGQYEQVNFDQHVEIRNAYARASEESTDIRIGSNLPNVNTSYFGKTTINIIVKKLRPSRAYNIGSAEFVGNKTLGDDELKKALGLDHSGYFDVQMFIDKIREFNKSGRFRPITEHDIDLEIGEKGRDDDELADEIQISIRVRELPKRSSHPR